VRLRSRLESLEKAVPVAEETIVLSVRQDGEPMPEPRRLKGPCKIIEVIDHPSWGQVEFEPRNDADAEGDSLLT
jgi:hypothetical protein